MGHTATKTLVFPSVPSETPKILQAILDEVRANQFSENSIFAIRLAMDEALSNAVRHGNCGDSSKNVTVEYTITDDAFKATVTDEGCGFVPDQVPDPTCNKNIQRPSGRGVMLMKAYMTHVEYNDCGNCVTLVKKRNCPLPAKSG